MRGTCGFPSLRQCVHASVLGCDTLDGKGIAELLGLNYQTFMSSISGQPKHQARRGLAPPHHGHDWLGGAAAIHGAGDGRCLRQSKALHGNRRSHGYAHRQRQRVRRVRGGTAPRIQGRTPAPRPADRILKEGQEALASIASHDAAGARPCMRNSTEVDNELDACSACGRVCVRGCLFEGVEEDV